MRGEGRRERKGRTEREEEREGNGEREKERRDRQTITQPED